MKLVTCTQVTLDGVMEGNGGQAMNRPGFERGGWARPGSDPEVGRYVGEFYQRADAFLFGRVTYDLFAGYWGSISDPANPIASALNSRPKHVTSNTLTEATWPETTVLRGDVVAAVSELKGRPGGELQVHGSGALIRSLLAADLVDELSLLVFPVIVGQGTRLFPDDGPDLALELVESRPFPTGITLQTYRPAGRPQYAG